MNRVRLLLVDAERLLLDGLRSVFDRFPDLEVVGTATDGREAVTIAREAAPDVVLIDLTVPKLNAVDVIGRIRDGGERPYVLGLTSEPEVEPVAEAIEAGASGCFSKRSDHRQMADVIRSIAAGERYLSPGAAAVVIDHQQATGDVADPVYAKLTPRQREVLRLLADGLGSKQVGATLSISPRTVDTHRRHIMERLEAESLADLVKHAIRAGLTTLET